MVKANQMVNISNLDSGMAELKKLLEEQQKLHKMKDDQIAKLENQVRILGVDNDDLTIQLNKDQFYDASEKEDDDLIKVNALILTAQDAVLQEPLQELAKHTSTVVEGIELVK